MTSEMKIKIGAVLGVISAGLFAFTFLKTLHIDVVSVKPEGCQRIADLAPKRFESIEFLAIVDLKNNVNRLGGDTLYVPTSNLNLVRKNKLISGIAYICNGSQ